MQGGRGDFREFFDIRKLDERQLGQIEFVLNSPAYEESFKPYMLGILATMNSMWKDRSKERLERYPDEFLAGGAVFGEGLIKFFALLIHETSFDRIHEAMIAGMSNDKLYDMKRQSGALKPVVGLDQPASPIEGGADPDEF